MASVLPEQTTIRRLGRFVGQEAGVKAVILLCTLAVGQAFGSEKKVALVIGNGDYEHVPALDNPRNDAEDMAEILADLKFDVVVGTDVGEGAFWDHIDRFAESSRNATTAIFFYAGHAVQLADANFLLPVDVSYRGESRLKGGSINLDEVLARMGGGNRLVFLDACRDNPFRARIAASRGASSPGVPRGLKRVDTKAHGGIFIAYATGEGEVAEDSVGGRNSPFTAALKEHILTPGLELSHLMISVAKTVRSSTNGDQKPWSNSSLAELFYFVSPAGGAPVAGRTGAELPSEPGMDPEQEEWRIVRDSGNPGVVRDFLKRYPNGRLAGAARALLAQLSVWPFTVAAEPAGARIRLADRPESYHAGMMLPAGDYRVEVSADGYGTRMVTVRHDGSPTTHPVALRRARPKAGDRFRDCSECPEMVVVPAGSYRMGSPSYEQRRQEDEGPVHEVTIAAPFAIGRHEVTVAEFGRFVDAAGYSAGNSCRTYEGGNWEDSAGRGWRNPGFGQSGGHPVACVNWNDAQAYVAWLSRETSEEYRLPSESEWEYAARAGTATAHYWGEGESGQCRHANGADASLKDRYSDWPWPVASCRDGHVHTAPVGSFAANGWGLHDVLGNVWEWTEDCWNDSYAGAPSDGSAWEYGDCSRRVLRGGSWNDRPANLRAAYRDGYSTGVRYDIVGFRVARTLAP